jgi:hypothetical protein
MSSEAERRGSKRIEGIILVELDREGRHGVTRDMSERGLKIATRSVFNVGDRLEITIRAKTGSIDAKARVVRVDKSPEAETWPYHVALELDEGLPSDVLQEGEVAATLLGAASGPPARYDP